MAARYPNVRTVTADGTKFASKMEARRWEELRLLERAGEIRNLRRQVAYELAPAVTLLPQQIGGKPRKAPPLRYVADFVYEERRRANPPGPMYVWADIVEDCKGAITDQYRIKRHLMKALLGLDIRETQPR